MKNNRMLKTAVSLAICMMALPATTTYAQESERVLEEVLVTATKRTENLMDIPVSVSAVTGEKISDLGIQDLNEASAYIPGFSVQPNPIADNINIRGVQSGNQAGFEQSVSTFVDGVYRGRGVQSRFAFLDVGLLEVLRGPQGTLFGKNTIGGALNISSAKPTDSLTAGFGAKYNLDFEETDITGFVAGPMSDKLRGRVAFQTTSMDKGWVENVGYAEDNPRTDDTAVRGILEYDMSERTDFTFRAETGSFEQNGAPWDLVAPGALAAFGVVGDRDGVTNMTNGPGFFEGIFGPGSAGNTAPIDFGSNQKVDGEVSEYALTMNHALANDGEITAIAAYSEYDFERFLDADFNPVPAVRFDDTEDFEQNSLEIRYASPQENRSSFIGGLYFQESDLYADGLSYFNLASIGTLATAGCLGNGGFIPSAANPGPVPTDPLVSLLVGNLMAGVNTGVARSCLNGLLGNQFVGFGLDGLNRYAFLEQDNSVKAIFGEFTYDVTDTFSAKLGLRYTDEQKEATQGVYAAQYADRGTVRDNGPVATQALALLGEATAHTFTPDQLSRDEGSFTWSLTGSWDYNADTLFYASASTGFKAGGFNSFAFSADPAEAEYEEEEAFSVELGGKFTLADGAAELNVAIFNSTFDDLQTSLFAGSTSFVVQNAAEATSTGIELDGRWQATDNLFLVGSAAYTNFEFDSFPNAGCTVDQLIALRESVWGAGDPTGALITLQQCGQQGLNDLSGRTSENTPEFSASLGLNHTANVFAGFELVSTLDFNYQGEQFRVADLDPLGLNDSVLNINGSLTIGPQDGNWDVSLIGNNLTDNDDDINYLNDTPLFDGARQAALMPPRSFSLRFRYKY